MPRRRALFLAVATLLLAWGVYVVWQAWQLQGDLRRAESEVRNVQASLDGQTGADRDLAIEGLRSAASSARSRTDGPLWGALTLLPVVGDDARALKVMSDSLALIADGGLTPLSRSVDDLARLGRNGQIDVSLVRGLELPVQQASVAFTEAAAELSDVDSSGLVDLIGQRFDEYAREVNLIASRLRSARVAITVLPDMLGADGPRDYLLIFQNNAELRATGGLPGSWALIHADDGRLTMRTQGGAGDFPIAERPVLPLSAEEQEVYGLELGTYFQDPGFQPDFARAADFWRAHWDLEYPEVPLDGVLAMDPVALSYLLEGTGPVTAGGRRLTSSNAVAELLSRPYLELEPDDQDEFFEQSARAVFDASTDDLASPLRFVGGITRAGAEGRFLMAPFDEDEVETLRETRVSGRLSGDDGAVPHVDVGLNDATGSKMSYYLRYDIDVKSVSCRAGRQQLGAQLTLGQTIAPAEAAKLPGSVTGGGIYGTEPGSQTVPIRIYAPYGGSIGKIALDGETVEPFEENVMIDGRQVVTVVAQVSTRRGVVLNWAMEGGPGQTRDGRVGITASVVPGDKNGGFDTSC